MAPPGPKTAITRTRTGCLTCRRRRTKCDEAKPVCRNCTRLDLHCAGYSTPLVFRDDTEAVAQRSEAIEAQKWAAIRSGKGGRKASTKGESSAAGSASEDPDAEQDGSDLQPVFTSSPEDFNMLKSEPESSDALFPLSPAKSPEGSTASARGHVLSRSVNEITIASLSLSPSAPSSSSSSMSPATPRPEKAYVGTMTALAPSNHTFFRPPESLDSGMPPPAASPDRSPSVSSGVPSTPGSVTQGTIDVTDQWITDHFPPQLPPVFKDIWQGVGYSDQMLKCALLSLVPPSMRTYGDATMPERKKRLEFYILAIQLAKERPQISALNVTQAVVALATLTLFLHVEIKVGSFIGGFAHYTESEKLVIQHMDALAGWDTGRRMICAWMGVKCWYSAQCGPWTAMAIPLTHGIRQSLWRVLIGSDDMNHCLLPILCEVAVVHLRLILARVLGPDMSYPHFQRWGENMAAVGRQPPPDGFYGGETEENHLARLAILQNDLDEWHDRLPLDDLPVAGTTSRGKRELSNRPATLRFEPLRFRSHQAAMTYARYAMAQIMCSREMLDYNTKGDLSKEPPICPWTTLFLQIITSIDPRDYASEDGSNIGLMWMIIRVMRFRALDPAVLAAIERMVPWFEDAGKMPGSMCPPWMLQSFIQSWKSERDQGRVWFLQMSEIGPAEDWAVMWSNPVTYRSCVVGRVVATGEPYSALLDI